MDSFCFAAAHHRNRFAATEKFDMRQNKIQPVWAAGEVHPALPWKAGSDGPITESLAWWLKYTGIGRKFAAAGCAESPERFRRMLLLLQEELAAQVVILHESYSEQNGISQQTWEQDDTVSPLNTLLFLHRFFLEAAAELDSEQLRKELFPDQVVARGSSRVRRIPNRTAR